MRGEAPWLAPEAIAVAVRIAASHQRAFGRPLLAVSAQPRLLAQELFAAATVVLAHDGVDPSGEPGPRLIYANRAALQLWRRSWAELVGMPSRLTAEAAERADRARALGQVRRLQAIANYSGIRIDSQGRRFRIEGARVWTLWSEATHTGPATSAGERPCGQAAAFSAWHWL